jgi:hypothetical protein
MNGAIPTTRLISVALGLAAWLGAALLLAAAVAPAAFAVLPSRTLAGAVVGRVLPVIFLTGLTIGALLALVEIFGTPVSYSRGRLWAGLVLAFSCAMAQFVVAPRIARLRDAVGGPIDQLAADDVRRVLFLRLHGFSVLWLGTAMAAALIVVVLCVLVLRARS